MAAEDSHAGIIDDLVRRAGVVMLVGASNTGKTTFARRLLEAAIDHGRTTAFVDADVDQSLSGPPTCVSLKYVETRSDLDDLEHADALQFVGSITPECLVLQHVVATGTIVHRARDRADLVVIDTTGLISGVIGQSLKYHKMEMCRPDIVVGIQSGGELEPLIGMLRRFFSMDVEVLPVDVHIAPASPEDRHAHRAKLFAEAFAPPLQRWRVRPTVFAPTLPAGLDLSRLNGVLVGVMDGTDSCLGLGVLEYEDDILRVQTNTGEGMRGLRLGSLRIDLITFEVQRVRLREVMFGLD
ncbi:hypothetical protein HQ535_15215 [bacterium]|nr:hypothetical protein [bacterium]